MGDFNADCSYVSKSEWPFIRLRSDPRFLWLIGDGIDTTTKATHCAYDRHKLYLSMFEQVKSRCFFPLKNTIKSVFLCRNSIILISLGTFQVRSCRTGSSERHR